MKKLIIGLCLLSSTGFAQTKHIDFEATTFAEMKAKAKKENKLIFMDAFTTWCGPCKWMAKNVFTNDTIADYFNGTFVNAKIDMEKGEGLEIAKQYQVSCYPNLLFIDGDGNLVHRSAGSRTSQEFLAFAKDAQNPNAQFVHFKKEYETNPNPAATLKYLDVLSGTCLSTEPVVANYFKSQKEEDLSNKGNWEIIKMYSTNYKGREFVYLLNNTATFDKKYTADSVNTKIKEVFLASNTNTLRKKDFKDADYTNYRAELAKMKFKGADEVLFKLDLSYFKKKKDWNNYATLLVKEGDKNLTIQNYNDVSWTLFENSDNKIALEKAASWMKKLVEEKAKNKEHVYAEYDTYASVLYKLNKKKEAKATAEKAIAAAKNEGLGVNDYQGTTEMLAKIEALK